MPVEPRRKDPGVVQNQQVARSEQIRKLPESPVLPGLGLPVQVEQARSGAIRQRFLGNEFRRQMVMEVGDKHREIIGFEAGFPHGPPPVPGTFYLHIFTLDWL